MVSEELLAVGRIARFRRWQDFRRHECGAKWGSGAERPSSLKVLPMRWVPRIFGRYVCRRRPRVMSYSLTSDRRALAPRASAAFVEQECGGAGGIRTLDTVLPYTHFPGERLRPLGHRSACPGTRPSSGAAGLGQGELFQAGRPRPAARKSRHQTLPSILRASAMSFAVTPPSLWVESRMSTRFQTFDQSGWWSAFSASSATRTMNPKASPKSANLKLLKMPLRPWS